MLTCFSIIKHVYWKIPSPCTYLSHSDDKGYSNNIHMTLLPAIIYDICYKEWGFSPPVIISAVQL